MKKKSFMLFASIATIVIFLLLPSCLPNQPGGGENPTPNCYRYDVVYDSIHNTWDTIRVQIPCIDTIVPIDSSNVIHCDSIVVDTITLQPIYVWDCDTVIQYPNDTLACHYVFSHYEMRPSSFIRLENCR